MHPDPSHLQEQLRLSRLALQQSLQKPPELNIGTLLSTLARKKFSNEVNVSRAQDNPTSLDSTVIGVQPLPPDSSDQWLKVLSVIEQVASTTRWILPLLTFNTLRLTVRNSAKKHPWILLAFASCIGASLVWLRPWKRLSGK